MLILHLAISISLSCMINLKPSWLLCVLFIQALQLVFSLLITDRAFGSLCYSWAGKPCALTYIIWVVCRGAQGERAVDGL